MLNCTKWKLHQNGDKPENFQRSFTNLVWIPDLVLFTMRFLNWEKSCVIPGWIRCSIEKVAVVSFANLWTQFLLMCRSSFSISIVFILFSCLFHCFHCNRSVYWWWCSSSSMVCGKRWTNSLCENRRFFPSCCSCVVLYSPFNKLYFGIVSALSRRSFAFSFLALFTGFLFFLRTFRHLLP